MNKNNLNFLIVEGKIVRDADLLFTKNANSLCKFDLAIKESYKLLNSDK